MVVSRSLVKENTTRVPWSLRSLVGSCRVFLVPLSTVAVVETVSLSVTHAHAVGLSVTHAHARQQACLGICSCMCQLICSS